MATAEQARPKARSRVLDDGAMSAAARALSVGARLVPVLVGVIGLAACDMIPGLGAPGPEVVEPANAHLRSGDLPAAASEYASLAGQYPSSVHVGVGQAYMQLLQGDLGGADATLAALEEGAGEQLPEIKLRRALVALQSGDLDTVKVHALASGMPQGKLLAAEVMLADLDLDEVPTLLREVSAAGGVVGQTAARYLEMFESGNQTWAGLAQVTALWALGDRRAAKEAEQLVRSLPADDGARSEQLLLWAGRAVTSGYPDAAQSLLDEIDFPPDGQAWRIQATRALVHVARGEVSEGVRLLDALSSAGAPADGVADARATACALVEDKAQAREIAGDLESPAVARCLSEAGADRVAQARAPEGPLKSYLEAK